MITKLESLKSEKFRKLENEEMNKINGGLVLASAGSTANTPVCTGSGGQSKTDPDERDCDDDQGNWGDC